jgi:dephospho-CoA kinase
MRRHRHVAEILKKQHGFTFFSYSDILREEAKKRNIELTRKNLQDLGDQLRKEQGLGVLSKILIEKISSNPEKDYIVGNIRNPGEVEELRKKFRENFILIKIDAPEKIRFKRLIHRRRENDPQTYKEFVKH